MRGLVTIDSVCDQADPIEGLLELKAEHPDLKASVFVIPGKASAELIDQYKALDWIEIGVTGFYGASLECFDWSHDEARDKLLEGCRLIGGEPYKVGFRVPSGIISGAGMQAIKDLEMWTLDHPRNVWLNMKYATTDRVVQGLESDVSYLHFDALFPVTDWGQDGIKDCDEFAFASDLAEDVSHLFTTQEEGNYWGHLGAAGQRAMERIGMMVDLLSPTGKLVDIGGNDGTVAWTIKKGYDLDCTVVDVSPFKVAFATFEAGVKAVCCDAIDTPFADNEFEWGFCSHTLEHVEDLDAVLAEAHRICEKGLFVVIPIEDAEKFATAEKHVRYGSVDWWLEALGAEKVAVSNDWGEEELICLIRY